MEKSWLGFRLTLIVCSVVGLLISIVEVTTPENVTKVTFPEAEGFAMEVGVTLRYMIVSLIFGIALAAFSLRNIADLESQKVTLIGFGRLYAWLAFAFVLLVVFRDLPPTMFIVAIVTWLFLSGLCFWCKRKLA